MNRFFATGAAFVFAFSPYVLAVDANRTEVKFCDCSSAGNPWSPDNRCRAWFPGEYN